MIIDIDSCTEVPWRRGTWHGRLLSNDGTSIDDFQRENVKRVIAYHSTLPDDWEGKAAGIAELNDGRFVSWDSWWGVTGSGFSEDAYGGNVDIYFSSTADAALRTLPEDVCERLNWASLDPVVEAVLLDVWQERREGMMEILQRIAADNAYPALCARFRLPWMERQLLEKRS